MGIDNTADLVISSKDKKGVPLVGFEHSKPLHTPLTEREIRDALAHIVTMTHFSTSDLEKDANRKLGFFVSGLFIAQESQRFGVRFSELLSREKNPHLVDESELQPWEIAMFADGRFGAGGPKGKSTLEFALRPDLDVQSPSEFVDCSEESRVIGTFMRESIRLAKEQYAGCKYPIPSHDGNFQYGKRLDPNTLTIRLVVPVNEASDQLEYNFLDLPYEEAQNLFSVPEGARLDSAISLPGVELLLRGVVPEKYVSSCRPTTEWYSISDSVDNVDYEPPLMTLGVKKEYQNSGIHPIERANHPGIAIGVLPTYRRGDGKSVKPGLGKLFFPKTHVPKDGIGNLQFCNDLVAAVFETRLLPKYAAAEKKVPIDYFELPKVAMRIDRPLHAADHDPFSYIAKIGPREVARALGITAVHVSAEMPAALVNQLEMMTDDWERRPRTSLSPTSQSEVPIPMRPLVPYLIADEIIGHTPPYFPVHPVNVYDAWIKGGRKGEPPRLGIMTAGNRGKPFLLPIELSLREWARAVEHGEIDHMGVPDDPVVKLNQIIDANLANAYTLEQNIRQLFAGIELSRNGQAPITSLAGSAGMYREALASVSRLLNPEITGPLEGGSQISQLVSFIKPGKELSPVEQVAQGPIDFGSAGAKGVDIRDGVYHHTWHKTIDVGDPFTWVWITRTFLQESSFELKNWMKDDLRGDDSIGAFGTFFAEMTKMQDSLNLTREMRKVVNSDAFKLVFNWLTKASDASRATKDQNGRVLAEIPIYKDYSLLKLWESSGSHVPHRELMQEMGNVMALVWSRCLTDPDLSPEKKQSNNEKLQMLFSLYAQQKLHVGFQRIGAVSYILHALGQDGKRLTSEELGREVELERDAFARWLQAYIRSAYSLRTEMARVIHQGTHVASMPEGISKIPLPQQIVDPMLDEQNLRATYPSKSLPVSQVYDYHPDASFGPKIYPQAAAEADSNRSMEEQIQRRRVQQAAQRLDQQKR